ncbi:MAG TPA: ATPase domain-containing protein [Oligoflexus sp.]|uniref:ATPase domain-containing protein n=1 Tax=Oligoflexus sp. TaxID=1971216 RepID=UPI002D30E291|nr:ATPase domain-containing protein [Oligoflexus sp.]HYX37401.1 ATPase domain-containing protein [Oligoflexus sp.]
MRELIPTGIAGLDDILLGGVLKGNVIVVEGMPGTGKSTMASEFLYRGARDSHEPGLIVCFETSAQKIARDAAGFGWDILALVRENKLKILELQPSVLIDELQSEAGVLSQEIARIGAKRVVIDGLTPLRILSSRDNGQFLRETLHRLWLRFASLNVTAMLTTEVSCNHPIGEAGAHEEQFLADTLITLRKEARRRSVHRSIEIAKSRGQDFFSGRHAFAIQPEVGVRVFPRVYARPKHYETQPSSTERISSGNGSLDRMLGGGLLKGSVTLVGGISGTGKTILGMQFLTEGAKQGDRSLLVSLDEHPEQILRNADELELEFSSLHAQGQILLHYDSPLEVELDEHFYSIKSFVEKHDIKRVVIDSVAAYESTLPDESREFCVTLASYLKGRQITTIFNFECPELLGISQINDRMKSSAVADNIVLLNYIEISTMIRRAITIPKSRASKPDQRTREYIIQPGGIMILDDKSVEGVERVPQLPLSSYYGVLARAPTRHSPVIDEHVAAGKPLPKSRMPSSSLKSKKDSSKKSKKGR